MRSNRTPGSAHGRIAVAAARYTTNPVADKAMGLPGGRRQAPSGRVILAW
jgi:hypothetical protein